jgi:hypothetical protein
MVGSAGGCQALDVCSAPVAVSLAFLPLLTGLDRAIIVSDLQPLVA